MGIQGGQFAFQEGIVATMVCMWMQQCGATNGRFVEQAGRYVFGAGSNIGAVGTFGMHAVQEHRRAARMIAAVVTRSLWAGHQVLEITDDDDLILVGLE